MIESKKQFTPIDVLALSNFSNALNLMDQTMDGKVKLEFESIVGVIDESNAEKWRWLKNFKQYMIKAELDRHWSCGLGYYLYAAQITDYPTVRIYLQVGPKSPHRTEIIAAMQEVANGIEWYGYNLDQDNVWAGIVRERSLQDFLSTKDHIAAIEGYFLELLNALAKIKARYAHLPWEAMANNRDG